jgi:hypothetical protein
MRSGLVTLDAVLGAELICGAMQTYKISSWVSFHTRRTSAFRTTAKFNRIFHVESIGLTERLYGPEHPDLYDTVLNYVEPLELAGHKDEALRNQKRAQRLYEAYSRWDSRIEETLVLMT